MKKQKNSADAERQRRWKRLQSYGAAAMKRAGIRSEEELQAVLYEIRHGKKLEDLRQEIKKGLESGASKPFNLDEMKKRVRTKVSGKKRRPRKR